LIYIYGGPLGLNDQAVFFLVVITTNECSMGTYYMCHILWLERGYFDITCIFAILINMILYLQSKHFSLGLLFGTTLLFKIIIKSTHPSAYCYFMSEISIIIFRTFFCLWSQSLTFIIKFLLGGLALSWDGIFKLLTVYFKVMKFGFIGFLF
jgi:hypothetical protein